ncbi:Pro-a-factor processing enzyme [Komagataella phaffii]
MDVSRKARFLLQNFRPNFSFIFNRTRPKHSLSSSMTYQILTENVVKPDLDDRSYRVIELPNKLRALLIHDPTTDKAAASLDVNVGNFYDPKDLPGLAHFCEHLLFMGTEKYPQENEYSSYLSSHSGRSNAYTSSQDTNYHFEIDANFLEGALDRFAQFFISPLFSKSCKDREIQAVDSENKKNLQNDDWRLHQLDKSITSLKHPYNNFSTGNIQTLQDIPQSQNMDVRDELLKFHDAYYSANIMRLVVLGKEDLDTLTSWTVSKFSAIANSEASRPYFPDPPYTSKELGIVIKAKPVMDKRVLEIAFPIPDQAEHWGFKPQRYFSHLIGHESKGSLFELLKTKGWATDLSSGAVNISKDYSTFLIEIDLTPQGLSRYEEIIYLIFQYIELLRQTGPQRWIFEELKDVSYMNFKFRQKARAASTVSSLSRQLQKDDYIPMENILDNSVLREWDDKLISDFLTYLTPDNFRIMVVAPEFEESDLPLREKWYGTAYSVIPFDPNFLDSLKIVELHPELHLPIANEFIPKNFEVRKFDVDEPLKTPKLIKDSPNSRIWFKKDDQFWVPKGSVTIKLQLPITQVSVLNYSLTTLYTALVEDFLNDIAYDAAIVGLRFTLDSTTTGLRLKVEGYNDKLVKFLDTIIDKIIDFTPTQERYNVIREKTIRQLKNFHYYPPFQIISQYGSTLLNDKTYLNEETMKCLETEITYGKLVNFIPTMYNELYSEILVHGNFERSQAFEIGTHFKEKIHRLNKAIDVLAESDVKTNRSVLLPTNQTYRFDHELPDKNNTNSCTDYFIQVGEHAQDVRLYNLLALFSQIVHEPCFNRLRTNEQLGYVVFSGVRKTRTTCGFRILVQSERTTDYLEYRIYEFLKKVDSYLLAISEEEFKEHVDALISKNLQKLKNLGEEYSRFWNEITIGTYDFLAHETSVKYLKQFSKQDVIDFYRQHIINEKAPKLIVNLKAQSPSPQTPFKLVNSSVLNYLSQNEIKVSVEDVEAILTTHKDEEFKDRKDIEKLLTNDDFRELLPKETELQPFIDYVYEMLVEPVPKGYPTGSLITHIGSWKGSMALTQAVQPVVPLETFHDENTIVAQSKL